MAHSTIFDLLGPCECTPAGRSDIAVTGIAYRSDRVRPGDAFFCIRGFAHDGHSFAQDAVARGAALLVVERLLDTDAPQCVVSDTRRELAIAASRFYGQPSAAMDVIGITGTNGKTTTTYLVDSILRAAGRKTGVIGTIGTRIGDSSQPSSRTTPESADLHALFATMRDSGVNAVAMEVSSHAVDLHRVDGTAFAAVAFTNLTQDHLDYHHTLEEYFSVKKKLFTDFDTGARIVDIDDPFGTLLAAEIPGCVTVGRASEAAVRAEGEVLSAEGSVFTLVTPVGEAEVALPVPGAFNVSNALVAAACCLAIGIDLATVVAGLQSAPQVPGRLELVDCGQPFSVIVDYAHTPDSLEKAIAAVRTFTTGDVIVVFGCGGDRDPDKRPLMGEVSAAADRVILTSDNPRSEDPVGILLQIEDGIRRTGTQYDVIVDRREAIAHALNVAQAGDTVLIAGKGHEDYQIFVDRTVHFDDREVAREVLSRC